MKESREKIITVIAIIILIAGIIIVARKGFNFDLHYQEAKKIELNIGKGFNIADIKEICKQVLGEQQVIIQKIEIYEDAVSIVSKEITEQQRNDIVTKINEKYGTQIETEDIKVATIPHIRLRDILSRYVMPFTIVTILIVIYVAIRYIKLDTVKVIGTMISAVVELQLLLFCIIGITRIPIGRLTLPMMLSVYMLSLAYCIIIFERKKLEEKTVENEDK